MIVKQLEDLIGTEDEVKGTLGQPPSVAEKDEVGFSLHDTLIKAGTVSEFWYKNHIEAVYCIEGKESSQTRKTAPFIPSSPAPSTPLDGHEKHRVRAGTDLRMVCVFNPPCTGRETHDEEGAYPLLD